MHILFQHPPTHYLFFDNTNPVPPPSPIVVDPSHRGLRQVILRTLRIDKRPCRPGVLRVSGPFFSCGRRGHLRQILRQECKTSRRRRAINCRPLPVPGRTNGTFYSVTVEGNQPMLFRFKSNQIVSGLVRNLQYEG